ncbi:MAG: hypothetical protein ACAH06_09690 [Methylophilaceae bacterium]|jgi:hypothetical protein|uniref:hypothetical protein n=1 Tax=Methylobacillus sp. MM3 TaxID=1848039 RepID=UPI0007E2A2A2|nr:hypothetical protein [Methylobacillus sp. MM3]OAJ70868.1 hypothetical protein A7976_05250 [Methylobacillus sp. MM3]
MTAAEKKKQPLIWGALVLTLATTAWVAASDDAGQEDILVKPRPRASSAIVDESRASATNLAYQPRPPIEGEPEDIFPGDAPPEEIAAAAPPPKPVTPPLPFNYAGKLVEDGNALVFLTHGTRNLAVRSGDVIDGVWRVESIRPPTMMMGYLPLKTVVPLVIGETN